MPPAQSPGVRLKGDLRPCWTSGDRALDPAHLRRDRSSMPGRETGGRGGCLTGRFDAFHRRAGRVPTSQNTAGHPDATTVPVARAVSPTGAFDADRESGHAVGTRWAPRQRSQASVNRVLVHDMARGRTSASVLPACPSVPPARENQSAMTCPISAIAASKEKSDCQHSRTRAV